MATRVGDFVPYAVIGAGVWLVSSYGQSTRDAIANQFKTAFPALSKTTTPPAAGAQSGTGGQQGAQQPVTKPVPVAHPDTPTWTAYKVALPTSTMNAQIWVQNNASGKWRYVASPSEFGTYGIVADESNVRYIGWPTRAFESRAPVNYTTDAPLFWLRSDTPSGINGIYPQVPSDATAALRSEFAKGYIVPSGPTGWAVLNQQGISTGNA